MKVLLILFSFVICSCAGQRRAEVKVQISSASYVTHSWFLSWGMDSNLIRQHWQTFDFSSVKLRTLARGLAPAFLRLMGTDGDHMIYSDAPQSTNLVFKPHETQFPGTNFTFNSTDWDNINEFAADVGWRMLFGINAQLRKGSDWDAVNAMKILNHSIEKGYNKNIDLELGNEPDLWQGNPSFVNVTADQLAKDFNHLRNILDTDLAAFYKDSILVGPDVASAGSPYLAQFLSGIDQAIRAVTFHQYYGGPELKYVDNYTDPLILDGYKNDVAAVKKIVADSPRPELRIWQGETSSTYNAPDSMIGEDYVAGFMLLDKLGVSASMGVELLIRQTYFGFWFALVDAEFHPRPNYWTCLLFKQLVGTRVLPAMVSMAENEPQRLRVYSHCAKTDGIRELPRGAVVVYAMNLHADLVQFSFHQSLAHSVIDEYLLTPGDDLGMTSSNIKLNGDLLKMTNDFTLPELKPRRHPGGHTLLTLPSTSYAFYVLPNANAQACL